MSRAETFIQEHTRNCSNEIERNVDGLLSYLDYVPWLTPDQARKAVEIAREEIYEWLVKNASDYMDSQNTILGRIKTFNTFNLISDLKQAMKDE